MDRIRRITLFLSLLSLVVASNYDILSKSDSASAATRTLAWSIVNTPSDNVNGVIVSPSEINCIALGPDNRTFYCADDNNTRLYKSTDAGYSWFPDAGNRLKATGATLPVWFIATAPDDSNFIIAVTGASTVGPKQVYFSGDGGNNWQNTAFPTLPTIGVNEYISCLDISKKYGTGSRDIAVGTRATLGTGKVLNIQYSTTSLGAWLPQGALNDSVTSLKFSPSYDLDFAITALSSNAITTSLNFGLHDTSTNATRWNALGGYIGYPIDIGIGAIYNFNRVISTDLELPTDFRADDLTLRKCFASIMANNTTRVLHIDSSLSPNVFDITPPITPSATRRISSIAYRGSISTGILVAGEANTIPSRGLVNIWQSANPQSSTIGGATWTNSDILKSPSGGGNSGRANAILAWSADGMTLYCGTSSENTTLGGTGWAVGQWPQSKTVGQQNDESAFSYSTDSGYTWNQIGLIDTRISRLSDVAALENEVDAVATGSPNVLYLSTLNLDPVPGAPTTFDSVWRSTSDPLGDKWERVLLWATSDSGTILRVNPRETPRSSVVVFADLFTDNITYSADDGQLWEEPHAGVNVRDLAITKDDTIYILESFTVRKIVRGASAWILNRKINTDLLAPAHTICAPLKNATSAGGVNEDMVIVGTTGDLDSYVAWADFAKLGTKFTQLKELPARGWVHVVADSQFEMNKIIYAGLNDLAGSDGIIYRWTLGKSSGWDYLDPKNRAFFGIETLNDVLYGGWNFHTTPPLGNTGGVDRTLYPRIKVPPAPEWDDLTSGLPVPGNINFPVAFTREPSALKISSNAYNTLWAIDNNAYVADNKTGCLWSYIDSVAKLGPWPTSPPPGGFIGTDPATGRSQQVDFKWRQLQDIFGYDLMLAKDVDFNLPLSQVLRLTPVDNLTGAWIVAPADQQSPSVWIAPGILEVGRSYYWKVRGSRAIGGEIIHSPWSATMFFSVKPGFIVTAESQGPKLLEPIDGPCQGCKPPIRFTWTPIKGASKYEFVMATDAELQDTVTRNTTTTTAFEYKDKLAFNKPYFWQVKAMSPVISDPSPVGTFMLTQIAVTPDKKPAPPTKPASPSSPSDFWIWVIIVIAVVLLILINALAYITRRRS